MEYTNNTVVIKDTINKTLFDDNIYVNFIISHKVNIIKEDRKFIIIYEDKKILAIEFSSDDIYIDTNHKISNSYGSILNTTRITIKMNKNKLVTIISEIN